MDKVLTIEKLNERLFYEIEAELEGGAHG